MVQVGNENNNGMLFPQGKLQNGDATAFGTLLNSGIKAVRDFSLTAAVKPQIILHVAQLQDAGWWTKAITAAGVTDYDILGVSHYSKWSQVNTMQAITDSIRVLVSRYQKKVMVVETGYPWTGNCRPVQQPFSQLIWLWLPAFTDNQLVYKKDLCRLSSMVVAKVCTGN